MNRALQRSVSRFLLLAIVFAQLAVTAHACPKLFSAGPAEPVAMIMAEGESDCDHMGEPSPNLCAAHCQPGLQAVGHADSPSFPPADLPGRSIPLISPVEPPRLEFVHARHGIAPAAPPPHAILHCCFRI